MGRYDGKNVVITGGSSGLGLAAARHLVDEGARVLVTLLHEMLRRGVGSGLATLCVSGGMGMAMAIEAM